MEKAEELALNPNKEGVEPQEKEEMKYVPDQEFLDDLAKEMGIPEEEVIRDTLEKQQQIKEEGKEETPAKDDKIAEESQEKPKEDKK